MTYRTNTRDDTKGQRRHQLRGCTWVALPVLITIYQYLKTSGKCISSLRRCMIIRRFHLILLQVQGLRLTECTEQKLRKAFVYSFPTFLPLNLLGASSFLSFGEKRKLKTSVLVKGVVTSRHQGFIEHLDFNWIFFFCDVIHHGHCKRQVKQQQIKGCRLPEACFLLISV